MHRHDRPRLTRLCRTLVLAAVLNAPPSTARAQTPMPHDPQPAPAAPSRPDLVVHAFGSVDWSTRHEADVPNSFALGQVALFATSTINERVSVLAEVVLEASGSNTRVTTDLERLQFTYRFDDHLSLSAGRYHTGIGYYNAAFHHGSYFEIPIDRPRVFAFEDEGGVLPVHEVGLSARGKVPKTGSALRYVAEIGNGRRWTDPDTDEGRDQNDAKSTNVGLSLRPDRWGGVEVGMSFYRDAIPRPPARSIAHRITAAYVFYRTPSTEIMAEWLRLWHGDAGRAGTSNHGGYLQASQGFGRLRPYYRYDRLDIAAGTPFIGSFGSSEAHLAGLRVDPADRVGIKAQYERRREKPSPGFNAARVQLVFIF
jgi:hypothetical protein